jgi:hypothetical protein
MHTDRRVTLAMIVPTLTALSVLLVTALVRLGDRW